MGSFEVRILHSPIHFFLTLKSTGPMDQDRKRKRFRKRTDSRDFKRVEPTFIDLSGDVKTANGLSIWMEIKKMNIRQLKKRK